MDIKLEKGQKISVTLYEGTSEIEANALHDYLYSNYTNHTPVLLNNTNFYIFVEDVVRSYMQDIYNHTVVYKIILKGELWYDS